VTGGYVSLRPRQAKCRSCCSSSLGTTVPSHITHSSNLDLAANRSDLWHFLSLLGECLVSSFVCLTPRSVQISLDSWQFTRLIRCYITDAVCAATLNKMHPLPHNLHIWCIIVRYPKNDTFVQSDDDDSAERVKYVKWGASPDICVVARIKMFNATDTDYQRSLASNGLQRWSRHISRNSSGHLPA
jgi:hypothetical protein